MKSSEKRLLITFVVVLFLGANFLLALKLKDRNATIRDQRAKLLQEQSEIKSYLEMAGYWEKYRVWMDQNQPVFPSEQTAQNSLIDTVSTAQNYGVDLGGYDLEEVEYFPTFVQTRVIVRDATGSLENVMKWLHSLQRPDQFRVIRKLQLIPDRDDAALVQIKDFELVRWYRRIDDTPELAAE